MTPESKRNNAVMLMIIGIILVPVGAIFTFTGIGCCLGLPMMLIGSFLSFYGLFTARKAKYDIRYAQGVEAGRVQNQINQSNANNPINNIKMVFNRPGMWRYSINGVTSDLMAWSQILEECQKIGDISSMYLWCEGMDSWESAKKLIYQ